MTTDYQTYRFWETSAFQIGGFNKEGAWTSEETTRYTGAIALNIPGLPSHYGIPIGLYTGGEDAGSDMIVEHTGEEDVSRDDGDIVGHEDDPDKEQQQFMDYTEEPEIQETESVSAYIPDIVFDRMLKNVGRRRNKTAISHKTQRKQLIHKRTKRSKANK